MCIPLKENLIRSSCHKDTMTTPRSSKDRSFLRSLLVRVVLAICLIVAFYIGTFALVGALMYWPVWQWIRSDEPNVFLFLFSWISALFILQGLLHSREVFQAPGPELTEEDHPHLHAFVSALAAASQTKKPEKIYLTVDVNAFVGEVGGFFGFGQRRVMVLGMALLSYLNQEQLRGVLAHELGHFYKSHVWLAARVYHTRSVLTRLLEKSEGSPTGLLFRLYAEIFMRATQAISREQEREADRHAVRLVGAPSYAETLMRMSKASALFQLYFEKDVQPLFEAGHYPENIFSGFYQSLAQAEIDGVLEEIEPLLLAQESSSYDSHPSLADRLTLVHEMPTNDGQSQEPPNTPPLARNLISAPEVLEEQLSRLWAESIAGGLTPISWDGVIEQIVHPAIQERLQTDRERLTRLTGLHEDASNSALLWEIFSRLEKSGMDSMLDELYPPQAEIPEENRRDLALEDFTHTLGLLFGAIYTESGGCWSGRIGRPFLVKCDEVEFDPVSTMEDAMKKKKETSWFQYFGWTAQDERPSLEHG